MADNSSSSSSLGISSSSSSSSSGLIDLRIHTAYSIDSKLSLDKEKPIFLQEPLTTIASLFYGVLHTGQHGAVSCDNNTPVRFVAAYGAALPAPLVEDTTYYTTEIVNSINVYVRYVPDGPVITFSAVPPSVTLAPPGAIEMYHASGEYVYNTDCWSNGLDISSISPWNSSDLYTFRGAGTLISPRHVLFAQHVSNPAVGEYMHFVAQDGTVVRRQLTGVLAHPDYVDYYPDIKIGVLDEDVPLTISFAKVFPDNWQNYFAPDVRGDKYLLSDLPILLTDQTNKALVWDIDYMGLWYGIYQNELKTKIPTDPLRYFFCEDSIPGDSGEPLSLIINGELVILSTITFGTTGEFGDEPADEQIFGTDITHFKDDINTMMNTLGGGYQLTEIDLSDFLDYTTMSSSSSSSSANSSSSSSVNSSISSLSSISGSSSSSISSSSSGDDDVMVYPLELYTALNTDIMRLVGEDNDEFWIRLNSRTTKITIDSDTLEWFNPVTGYIITLSLEDDIDFMHIIDRNCYIQLLSIHPFRIIFYSQSISCNNEPLTESLTADLTTDLNEINEESPPKYWSNYNEDYRNWLHFKILAQQGVICTGEIPDEPKIEEYTALSNSSSSSSSSSSSLNSSSSSSSSSSSNSSSDSSSSSNRIDARTNAIEEVDSRISGLKDKEIFTTQDHATLTYVRNANCWAYDIDLTSISPWNSGLANKRAGILVTPRHVLFASHYIPSAADVVRFVTSDNTVVDRVITAIMRHPDTTPPTWDDPDLAIAVLDSDVPSSISFAKILPENWRIYFPYVTYEQFRLDRIPLLITDQEEKALVTDGFSFEIGGSSWYLWNQNPSDATRLLFFEAVIDGDSGSPMCMIINGELVVLSVVTVPGFNSSGAGTSVSHYRDDLNTMIEDLGNSGGYSLTEIDLSAFKTYPL